MDAILAVRLRNGLCRRPLIWVLLCTILLIRMSGTLYATHEADHRFTVTGYVRDGEGNPLSGKEVSLEHKGGQKKNTKTDSQGYYEAMFHLHNDNLGDEILVAVGKELKKVRIDFDPEDRFTDRRSGADFGAPARADDLEWVYWTSGVGLVLGAIIFLGLSKKKKMKKRSKKTLKSRKKR